MNTTPTHLTPLPHIADFGGMEFSTFQLKPGVSEAALIQAASAMATGLYAHEEGFLGHTLLKGKDGVYVDVVFATSQARAAQLCGLWGAGPFAPACLPYLEKIDENSVNMAFFQRIS